LSAAAVIGGTTLLFTEPSATAALALRVVATLFIGVTFFVAGALFSRGNE